jgi:hypothetical protein
MTGGETRHNRPEYATLDRAFNGRPGGRLVDAAKRALRALGLCDACRTRPATRLVNPATQPRVMCRSCLHAEHVDKNIAHQRAEYARLTRTTR